MKACHVEAFQALEVPASSFDFPELLKGTRQTLSAVEEELRNVAKFWNVAESMLLQVEGYRELLWENVDGVEIEIALKAMQKSLQRDVKVRSANHYGLMLGKELRLHLVKRVCTSHSPNVPRNDFATVRTYSRELGCFCRWTRKAMRTRDWLRRLGPGYSLLH